MEIRISIICIMQGFKLEQQRIKAQLSARDPASTFLLQRYKNYYTSAPAGVVSTSGVCAFSQTQLQDLYKIRSIEFVGDYNNAILVIQIGIHKLFHLNMNNFLIVISCDDKKYYLNLLTLFKNSLFVIYSVILLEQRKLQ